MNTIGVLFVCLGNICRSPMAEGIFLHLIEKSGISERFMVDSAGTSGYHAGEEADRRMQQTARNHGVKLTSRSRKINLGDCKKFDYIIAMDSSNHSYLEALIGTVPESASELFLMRKFDEFGENKDVPDPYWSGEDGFEEVYRILLRSNEKLLAYLMEKHGV